VKLVSTVMENRAYGAMSIIPLRGAFQPAVAEIEFSLQGTVVVIGPTNLAALSCPGHRYDQGRDQHQKPDVFCTFLGNGHVSLFIGRMGRDVNSIK